MAAPKRNRADEDRTRANIQATQLVNRLQNNALGKLELTPIQQRSIEILLKKVLPDLQAVTHKGDANAPLVPILNVSLSGED